MKRILILSDVENHCFAHRAAALQKYAPEDIDIEVIHYGGRDIASIPWDEYDLLFCLPTRIGLEIRKLWSLQHFIRRPPLVVSHNSGIGRRHDMLLEAILGADFVIINNYAAWASVQPFIRDGLFNAFNISNGVDRTIFYPDERKPDPGKATKVLWTATDMKARGEDDIKGYMATLQPLEYMLARLPEYHPEFPVIDSHNARTAEQMRDWYASGDILVCASRAEGTPNILLEGMSCGLVPVTTPVGNVPELIQHKRNGYIVSENTVHGFHQGLDYVRENLPRMRAAALQSIASWDWKVRSAWFYQLFRRIMARRTLLPYTYLREDPAKP